jgi:hypothetical protein
MDEASEQRQIQDMKIGRRKAWQSQIWFKVQALAEQAFS